MQRVEQYVMAYRADHDAIKTLLPEGYESLRPVLRINVEVITDEDDDELVYIEFNTPAAKEDRRGWLNLTTWDSDWMDIAAVRNGKTTSFAADFDGTEFLAIEYTAVGREGGCPKEDDNDGTFFIEPGNESTFFREAEVIDEKKEYCECSFRWTLPPGDDFTENAETVKRAMGIEPEEILGSYVVVFNREE